MTQNDSESLVKKIETIEAARREEIKELKLKLAEAREEARGQHNNAMTVISKLQNQLDAINQTISEGNAANRESIINALNDKHNNLVALAGKNNKTLTALIGENNKNLEVLVKNISAELQNDFEIALLKLSNVLEMLNIENTNVKNVLKAINDENANVKDVLKLLNDESAEVKNLLKLVNEANESVKAFLKTINEESENVKNDVKNDVKNAISTAMLENNVKFNELKEKLIENIRLKANREDIQKDVKTSLAETEELLRLIAANQMMDFTERK